MSWNRYPHSDSPALLDRRLAPFFLKQIIQKIDTFLFFYYLCNGERKKKCVTTILIIMLIITTLGIRGRLERNNRKNNDNKHSPDLTGSGFFLETLLNDEETVSIFIAPMQKQKFR